MLIVSIILGVIISLLILEKRLTQRQVYGLQLRVLVNGTRGKSSVTEYIAAGLSNARPDVLAKITGIIPTIIYSGERHFIKRAGVARVQEQISIIRLAAKRKAKSLVLECMSVAPELQRLESSVFRPQIYVITNIRDDHREEMGINIEEQADSICSAIPENCTVVTNENRFLNKIKRIAEKRNCILISIQELEPEAYNWLPYGIFSENVSLALAVCNSAGIDNKLAEDGIKNWISKSKSPLTTIKKGNKEIRFLNAFAVNDTDSTEYFINDLQKKIGYNGKISLVLNTRADRPMRTDLFTKWIINKTSSIDHIIITGDHSNRAKQSLMKAGIEREIISIWKNKHLKNFRNSLLETVGDGSLVIGIGNIGGTVFNTLIEL